MRLATDVALICEDCDGKGCESCKYKGFHVKNAVFHVDEDSGKVLEVRVV